MRVRLDPGSTVPLSRQLVAGIARAIERGTAAPGERLPTVRDLASELGIATNTVAKAYRELEADGFVVTRGRHGTYVAERLPEAPDDAERRLAEAADAFARRAAQLGFEPAEALRAVRRAFGR